MNTRIIYSIKMFQFAGYLTYLCPFPRHAGLESWRVQFLHISALGYPNIVWHFLIMSIRKHGYEAGNWDISEINFDLKWFKITYCYFIITFVKTKPRFTSKEIFSNSYLAYSSYFFYICSVSSFHFRHAFVCVIITHQIRLKSSSQRI